MSNNTSSNTYSVLGALNDLSSMMYMRAESNRKIAAYNHNAHMIDYDKWFADRAYKKQEEQLRKVGGQVLGKARVANAASGFSLSSVTSMNIEGATIQSIEEDAAAIKTMNIMEQMNFDIRKSDLLLSARLEDIEKKKQTTRSLLSAVSSAYGGTGGFRTG